MTDERIKSLASKLINYSCELKHGEKVLIEAIDVDSEIVKELVKEAYKVGAYPFVEIVDNSIKRQILLNTSKEHCELMAKFEAVRMSEMDAYIGVRGSLNAFELSDVPGEKNQTYMKYCWHPVHHDIRVKKTKWVVLRFPTPSFAQLMNVSTDEIENFYFDVCTMDYAKMDEAFNPLKKLMEKTDNVRVVGNGTDLSFSIKGIPAVKCSGRRNIPDGEIYTAPVKNSVNGVIQYNTPTISNGTRFSGIKLTFKDGKIVEATCNENSEKLNEILNTDDGSRFVGEFAIGVNPFITKPMCDILFDEKISGSIHFTPGSCYEEADNGNYSAIHWDMVLIQTKEFGGGEIYFDDVLIRKDGIFVLEELRCLNPENLK